MHKGNKEKRKSVTGSVKGIMGYFLFTFAHFYIAKINKEKIHFHYKHDVQLKFINLCICTSFTRA